MTRKLKNEWPNFNFGYKKCTIIITFSFFMLSVLFDSGNLKSRGAEECKIQIIQNNQGTERSAKT